VGEEHDQNDDANADQSAEHRGAHSVELRHLDARDALERGALFWSVASGDGEDLSRSIKPGANGSV